MMKFVAKISAVAVCVAAAALDLRAQSDVAMPFLSIDRSPVTSAMGSAGLASSSEIAYASFRNPAVIPFSERKGDFGVSYQNWAPDGVKSTNLNLGATMRLGKRIGVTLGGAYEMGEKYTVSDNSGNPKGTFTPSDMIVNAGMGVKIANPFSLGVNLRYASQSLADGVSYSAFAADVFALYRVAGVNITAGVSSVGSSIKSDKTGSFSLPASAVVAGAYTIKAGAANSIDLALDANYYFSGDFAASLGAQYAFKDFVFVRAGYHYGGDSVMPSFASVGVGGALFVVVGAAAAIHELRPRACGGGERVRRSRAGARCRVVDAEAGVHRCLTIESRARFLGQGRDVDVRRGGCSHGVELSSVDRIHQQELWHRGIPGVRGLIWPAYGWAQRIRARSHRRGG